MAPPIQAAAAQEPARFFVDDIVIDTGQRRAWRSADQIPLTRLTFDLLLALIERAPNVVGHEELADAVWGSRRVVTPETLTQCVLRLRHGLGDTAAAPRYIESIRGHGYRLIPRVERGHGTAGLRGRWKRAEPDHASSILAAAKTILPPRVLLGLAAAGLAAWIVVVYISGGDVDMGLQTGLAKTLANANGVLPNSIAVMPFEIAGAGADDALWADGSHRQLLSELARADGLNVIARASVLRYADTNLAIPAIAAALGVETVMQVTVRYAGEHARIMAELIAGDTGVQLWFGHYDTVRGDMYVAEHRMAREIADVIGAEMSSDAGPEHALTRSAEAYEFFLRAVDVFEEDPVGGSNSAQTYLDQAIALDPDFALAYALKALIYAYSIDSYTGPTDDPAAVHGERARLTREYANRSLALDPRTDLAYRALAIADMRSFHWRAARASFEAAIEINPNDVASLVEYAFFAACTSKDKAGLERGRRALALDPQNPRMYEMYGRALNCVAEHDAATAALRNAVELDRTTFRRRTMYIYSAARTADPEHVLAELRALDPLLTDARMDAFPPIAITYEQIGYGEEGRRFAERFVELGGVDKSNDGNSVFAYLALRDYDAAYRALEQAVENLGPGSGFLTLLAVKANARSIPVLEEPRFVALRKHIRSLD